MAGARSTRIEVWYAHLDVDSALQEYAPQFKPKQVKRTAKQLAKAGVKDRKTGFSKLTHVVDGKPRIVDEPPVIEPRPIPTNA